MKLILIIFLTLSSITQYSSAVIAQTKKPSSPRSTSPKKPPRKQPTSRKPVFVPPKTPSRLTPVSGRRTGMGSRDNCPAVSTPLTALVPFREELPVSKQNKKSSIGVVEGLTTAERPTLWFYVPYTQNLANLSAEFSLQDSNEMDIYRSAIALPQQPGVISVSLPNTVKPLEVGQTYRWYFKVSCQQQTGSLPVYVEGDIQRINLDSAVTEQLIAAVDPREKIAIYAKAGIWFDALNILAQLRQTSGYTSVREDWQSLLKSVQLDNIATAPLVNSLNRN
ncbi:DUF928 domain-containing protein [Rivularia sp. UHCC 0363]|uniref:DUF928 domain-containing protein n=1 Tax=Rivularia sp. UHCC 0363 TaxID=3110244 RepID=UPI002B1FB338|nr:DUF928 domain-containing protein [Rivularia sp. UHCC 0363]MEA5598407.1 DUF928 domain-containing protein [Rivularia sp. UHCC 0363]